MRARRWVSLVLLFLLGLAAGAAVFAYASRDNLVRYVLNPQQDFADLPAPPIPNYTQDRAWAVLPTKDANKRVDVFFISPTLFFSGEKWNAPIENGAVNRRIQTIIKPLYAGPFALSANLYIPRYRQAAPYSFMSSSEDGRKARELAYRDVAAAFGEYVNSKNSGRPLIIAGYGQGALYGLRLIAEMNPETKKRLIAAYLLEVALPLDVIKAMTPETPLCAGPDSTGCIVAWHSSIQGGRGDMARENALVWKPAGGLDPTSGRELACVNPLTWSIAGRAGTADMNEGGAVLSEGSPIGVRLERGMTGADCWNGLLFVDKEPDPMFFWTGPRYRDLFPSTTNPFYADIRSNATQRIESYLAQASLGTPPNNEALDPADERAPVATTP